MAYTRARRARRHRLGGSSAVRRRQMRRGRVGGITVRQMTAREWVLNAGGADDNASTYFCHLWRRVHRYVAPAVEKTIMEGVVVRRRETE